MWPLCSRPWVIALLGRTANIRVRGVTQRGLGGQPAQDRHSRVEAGRGRGRGQSRGDSREAAPLPCVQEKTLEGRLRLRNWQARCQDTHPCTDDQPPYQEGVANTRCITKRGLIFRLKSTHLLPCPGWEQDVRESTTGARDMDPGVPPVTWGPVRVTNPIGPCISSLVKGTLIPSSQDCNQDKTE